MYGLFLQQILNVLSALCKNKVSRCKFYDPETKATNKILNISLSTELNNIRLESQVNFCFTFNLCWQEERRRRQRISLFRAENVFCFLLLIVCSYSRVPSLISFQVRVIWAVEKKLTLSYVNYYLTVKKTSKVFIAISFTNTTK